MFGNILKQCKGKDLDAIAVSKQPSAGERYLISIKYDGNYVRIEKQGKHIRFFTRSKEFYANNVADAINNCPELQHRDFIIDTEYIGETDGKLGSRRKASLNSFIADFRNNRPSEVLGEFIVFDVIYYVHSLLYLPAKKRFEHLKYFDKTFHTYGPNFRAIGYETILFRDAIDKAKYYTSLGWEGAYLKHIENKYVPGKRVNDAIKLKLRPTIDVKCVAIERGSGKYDGMIGSLVCTYEGNTFKVGSGLTDAQRGMNAMTFIGSIIEVAYEQIMDNVPVQPTFICIRDDKE